MELLKKVDSANDGFRFILDLCVLASLGYWGFKSHAGIISKWAWGIGTPLTAAIAWALFVPPNASLRLDDPWRLLVELMVFGSGALALVWLNKLSWALPYSAAVTIHIALTLVLGQR